MLCIAGLSLHFTSSQLGNCSREDSNLHGLPHTVLSRTRLPIPPRELGPTTMRRVCAGATRNVGRAANLPLPLNLNLTCEMTTKTKRKRKLKTPREFEKNRPLKGD